MTKIFSGSMTKCVWLISLSSSLAVFLLLSARLAVGRVSLSLQDDYVGRYCSYETR